MSVSRRSFLGLTPAFFAPAVWPYTDNTAASQAPQVGAPASRSALESGAPADLHPGDDFPSHPRALATEMVIAAHGNVARVKELVARWPALSRACIDWGFGDWEDALGGASHVGHREIAELLIANGARPTIFSAAMLGQLDVVKAFVSASPGVEATPGPHGITLLRHAAAGGPAAQATLEYLKTLPAADRRPAAQRLGPDAAAALVGTYPFGPAASDRLIVELTGPNQNLSITRPGRTPRGLTHVGDLAFFPSGASATRIRFAERDGRMTVSVFDPDLIVTGEKMR